MRGSVPGFVAAALLIPMGIALGIPMPTGLRMLALRAPHMVAWAWGMNGVFSVLGSALVIFVSMLSNFTVAMLAAAVFYGLAGIISGVLWKIKVVEG